MSTPNELAQAIAWLQDCGRLQEIIADAFPKPDRWEVFSGRVGIHPDDYCPRPLTADPDLVVPDGYIESGPWEPMTEDRGVMVWKRPLRRIAAKDGGK